MGYDVSGPARKYVAVTKSDTVNFADGVANALYVGTAGTANLVRTDDVVVAVTLSAGYHPLVCKRVNTGGTAADILSLH